MTRLQASSILLLTGALWGFGFVAQRNAMDALGPHSVVAFRFVAATLAILPFALRESRRAAEPLAPRDWLAFVAIGLFLWLGSIAQQAGLLTTTVTNSGFLTGLYVVMVPLLGVLIFRQWPHPVIWPAVVVAMAGIFLLSGGHLGALTPGDWLTVFCAACFAMQLVLIGRFAIRTRRPVTLSVVQFAVCAVGGLVFALPTETITGEAVASVLPELLYAGIVAGGIGFTLQAVAQAHVSAPAAAILLASESIFAALFGALFLGERLPPTGLVGCALIFAAIVCVETVPAALARRRANAEARLPVA
ncbi:MAG: EamA family transporter [Mesorhizobium amorphae]|nr:MAG: EamA family transporter [Mesorhizobium amorphae]